MDRHLSLPAGIDQGQAVPEETLRKLAGLFGPRAEAVASFRGSGRAAQQAREAQVLAMLARRPCTARDVADGLGVAASKAERALSALVKCRRIRAESRDGVRYYISALI